MVVNEDLNIVYAIYYLMSVIKGSIIKVTKVLLPVVIAFGCKTSPDRIRNETMDAMKPYVIRCVDPNPNPIQRARSLVLRDLRRKQEIQVPEGISSFGKAEFTAKAGGFFDIDLNGVSFSQVRTCAKYEAEPQTSLPQLIPPGLPGRE